MSYVIRGVGEAGEVFYTGSSGSAFIDADRSLAKPYSDLSVARRAALRLNIMQRDASGYHFMVPVSDEVLQ